MSTDHIVAILLKDKAHRKPGFVKIGPAGVMMGQPVIRHRAASAATRGLPRW